MIVSWLCSPSTPTTSGWPSPSVRHRSPIRRAPPRSTAGRSTAGRSTSGRSAAGRSPAAAGHAARARRPGRRKAIGSAVASLEQVTVRVAGEAARREQLQECAVYDRSKPAQGKMLRRAAAPPTPLK